MAAKLQSNFPPTDCRWYGNRKEKLDAKEKLMGLISWLVVGALAGVLARRIVPGSDPGRSIVTIILGMAGASLGGFLVGVIGGSGTTNFDVWTVLVATLGAIALLYVYGLLVRRTA
jgi:uncharacterized membrane protein YeaQ/YmgE (transglycosylase-associated protein family)